ncbi:hypothetical protein [Marivita sp.]|uniref:hypothetical protein n=1 Tax=Marivita sp. TaxID=2003365 RepID=UPI003F6B7114
MSALRHIAIGAAALSMSLSTPVPAQKNPKFGSHGQSMSDGCLGAIWKSPASWQGNRV